jgi:HEAT repeat protein
VAGEPAVQAALLPLLADPAPTVRLITAAALRTVAGEPAVQAALLPLLADPDPIVRGRTATALRMVAGEPAVQAALLPLLADPDPIVRESTVTTLSTAAKEPQVRIVLLSLLDTLETRNLARTIKALGDMMPDSATRRRLGTLLSKYYGVGDAAFATLTRWAAVEDGLAPPREAAGG